MPLIPEVEKYPEVVKYNKLKIKLLVKSVLHKPLESICDIEYQPSVLEGRIV